MTSTTARIATETFQDKFWRECVEGSAIAPELFDAAIEFAEDQLGGEIHALLGWKYSRFWQYRKPHDFGVFAGFYGEDGELWQGKPEYMPPGMDGKYLGPKQGARAYLPPITLEQFKTIEFTGDSPWLRDLERAAKKNELPSLWERWSGFGVSLAMRKRGGTAGMGFSCCTSISDTAQQALRELQKLLDSDTQALQLFQQENFIRDLESAVSRFVETLPRSAKIPRFWEWLGEHPEVPIVLTEGGKKGLCGLSHGYAAIAAFGVDAFSRKGEKSLLPDLLPFIQPGRRIIIAFDEDTKRKTRRRVRAATARLGRYLIDAGASPKNICIAEWEPAQGKGLDDLAVQSGAAALHEAIANATPYEAWKRGGFSAYLQGKYPELFGLAHKPTLELNQQYLPSLQLPRDGGLMAISSPMGTGKTEAMKGLIHQARAIDPKCFIELIGYRNSLGKQSAQRLSLDHIHDLQGSNYAQTYIDTSQGLAYCLDSLHRRIQAALKAIAQGLRVLLLLDEIDAVLKHLFLGKTLGKRRGDIAVMFCELLRAVADGGGWIVAGEADLHSLPILFLEEVSGTPAQVIVNHWKGNPWQIEAPMPLNDKMQPSPALMDKAAIARTLAELEQGKRVAVATDSQQWGEVLDRLATAKGFSVLRLDGDSSEEKWAHELMQFPDEYLSANPPQLFIYSPTAESGLSIMGNHFDIQIVYGSHVEHRAIAQLTGRIRANILRVVFVRESNFSDESGGAMDPEQLVKDWQLNARYSAITAKLGNDAPSLDLEGLAGILHQFAAKYQARINISKTDLRGGLLRTFEALGHTIEQPYQAPNDQALKTELKEVKGGIQVEGSEAWAQAEVLKSLEKAYQITSSSSSKKEDRIAAEKTILLDRYPGLPANDSSFFLRNTIKSRGKMLKAHTALFMAQHPEVAAAIDRLSWDSQKDAKILWLPSISKEAPKAALVQQSGILELLEMEEHREDSPEVQRVRTFALQYKADIKRVLGLWCDESQTGIQISHKLAKRLGMNARIVRKEGPRGAQEKIWGWKHDAEVDDDRAAIFEALTRKWGELLKPIQGKESDTVDPHSSKRNIVTETETTAPIVPISKGGWALWRGQKWKVTAINESIATLIHPDDWAEVPSEVQISECLGVL